ncbi:MAG TPA: hypothetical protein VNT23_06890 [Gaiellaceae bacterium]|nr:hypothetical protein [Gaiellaceae bacterium]
MRDRTDAVGRNEALFRDVNERIRELTTQFVVPPPLEVVCECADAGCTQRIEVPVQLYERVRADGGLFLVAPGHVAPDVESVREKHGSFEVVEKDPGPARDLAEELDPRS